MITNNIIRFLQTEESVILNRLGKFSKKTIPSIVEGDTILPPKVILEFEFIEDGSGFPIVDKISKWESLRLLDADDAVNKWVNDLRESIQNNKSVVFENFGTFFLNDSQQICFESAVIKELNTEYLGMDPVPLTKSDKAKTPTVPIVNPDEMSTTDPLVEPVLEVIPELVIEEIPEPVIEVIPEPVIEEIPEPVVEEISEPVVEPELEDLNEEEIEIPRKKKRSWIGTLLFIIVILGAIAVILLLFKDPIIEFYNSQFKSTPVETPVVPVPQPTDNLEVDQLPIETDSLTEQPIPNREVAPTPVQSEISKPVQTQNETVKGTFPIVSMEKGKFYVIAGSFTKENDAITHIKDKKLGQYNPLLITGQSRIRVCIGTFSTEAEALAFAKRVDNTYWVLK